MAYQGQQPQGFGLDMAKLDPLTMKDVEERQARLDKLGLGDGWLGQANQWSGQMVGQRDALRTQVKSSLTDMLGVTPAAKSGLADAAGGAVKTAAKDSVVSGALGAAM